MLFRRPAPWLVAAVLALATAPALAQTPTTPPAVTPTATPATEVIRRSDLVAEYFAADPAKASPGAVIVLGGSEGGLTGSRGLARKLAAEGFAAIAVSYFGEVGQSPKLNEIAIEPVDAALAWLTARPEIHGPVAVMGVSKGAELALLTASRNPAIKAVVVGVPSSVVWAGIDQTGGPVGSSWTAQGQPLPYVPYDFSKGFTSIFNLYADSLPAAPAEAEIPVEAIAGPILMISGDADTLWPSSAMANRIEVRLRERGFAHPVTNIVYPGAGHAVFGTPVRADAPGHSGALVVGGTIEGLVAARADGWPRVLAFLRQALAR
ncbi:acyl-CoA thioester hydrolase/BAAT C-terminal domain-containing protein [Brevundimonas sp.]|uniref:acyl-CoA thioester hydrolase/BAAT C-terminal domain-containing protein n=1 Tax=Brevundimonas sp. TaxID=1871086 RepID=UPI001A25A6FC|nr:acyl-CoA thioester hydrolase/BAAT C-terminal domain-containing protein [Brevundimonas sp.]MBJ7484467.1 dienelactone hydrolase family protein [Brevundimonas sp.]